MTECVIILLSPGTYLVNLGLNKVKQILLKYFEIYCGKIL